MSRVKHEKKENYTKGKELVKEGTRDRAGNGGKSSYV